MSVNNNPAALALFGKPKQKFTVLALSGGMMGAAVKIPIITRPPHQGCLAYSEPRGRKQFYLARLLESGVMVFPGIVRRKLAECESSSFILNGRGGRLLAPDGAEELISFLVNNCVFHTLGQVQTVTAVLKPISSSGDAQEEEILPRLLAALPPSAEIGQKLQAPVKRHRILSDVQIKKLRNANPDSMIPLIKLFNPAGSATWLLSYLEEDGETLWGYADLGMGCVEFGTISLQELEELKLPLGLHIERDKFFDGTDYTPSELLAMESLPTNLRKAVG